MSNILLIVEGNTSEPKYLEQFIQYHNIQMQKNGNQTSTIIIESYGTLIYDLYDKISKKLIDEEFETIPVLIEILRNKNIRYDSRLNDYDQFSDIFLFFDLDAHYYHKRNNRNEIIYSKLTALTTFFNESTDKGKLLISYPMFEALKCFKDEFITESEVSLHLFSVYEVKSKSSRTTFKNKTKYLTSEKYNTPVFSIEKIEKLTQYFVHCAYFIINNKLDIANSQTIFENQFEKFIKPSNQAVILSAFPQFIVDIFGVLPYFDDSQKRYNCKEI